MRCTELIIFMKILLLSFYFKPDIGPGALRADSLIKALIEEGKKDIEIDIFTTFPNRYKSYQIQSKSYEDQEMIRVHRAKLPEHRSGMFDQTRAFLSYAKFVLNGAKNKEWDIIVATSSRLMTASLATYLAKKKNSKLYLDIRDLFTDTMKDILNNNPLRITLPFFRWLEKITLTSADRLNLVSEGFIDHIKQIEPNLKPTIYTNGIDEEFLNIKNISLNKKGYLPKILYAGNIGDGQALQKIIPDIAKNCSDFCDFYIYGDGGRRSILESEVNKSGVQNVFIRNPIPRKELLEKYSEADILLIHLNDINAFRKVLPSKIFEYAASGKPILAGVSGYAAEFLLKQVSGVAVFSPCDPLDMKSALIRLLSGPNFFDRNEFCSQYLRRNIMKKMAHDILDLHEIN